MDIKEIVRQLCQTEGVSGFERRAAETAKGLLEPYCDQVSIDNFDTVYGVRRCQNPDAKTILLDAHIDQIGFVVTEILQGGFVRFAPVGGVDPRMLLGAEVTLLAQTPVYGVIACTPPHLMKPGEEKNSIPIGDMVIDTGLRQTEKVIAIGTPVCFRGATKTVNNDYITSRSLDDRAGLAAIIDALSRLDDKRLRVHVVVMASCREEIGAIGAALAAMRLQPEYGIAVDVGHGKTPDAPPGPGVFDIGSGTMIGMGPNLHRGLTRQLIRVARGEQIPHNLEVMEGDSGTNAWSMQVAGQGIAMGLLSIPLRYMHTPTEALRLCDIRAVSDLLVAFLHQFDGEVESC